MALTACACNTLCELHVGRPGHRARGIARGAGGTGIRVGAGRWRGRGRRAGHHARARGGAARSPAVAGGLGATGWRPAAGQIPAQQVGDVLSAPMTRKHQH